MAAIPTARSVAARKAWATHSSIPMCRVAVLRSLLLIAALSLTGCYRTHKGRVLHEKTGQPIPNAVVEVYDLRRYYWIREDLERIQKPDLLQKRSMTPLARVSVDASGAFSVTLIRQSTGDLLVATDPQGYEHSEPLEVDGSGPWVLRWRDDPSRISPHGMRLELRRRMLRFH